MNNDFLGYISYQTELDRLADDLADEGEVGGLGIDLGGQGGRNEGRQGGEDELIHGYSRLFPQKYA